MQMVNKKGKLCPMVDLRGRFFPIEDLDETFVKEHVDVNLYGEYAGRFVKNAYDDALTEKDETLDVSICMHLKQSHKAFRIEKHVHSYPHCWRCDTPLIYYARESWFIKMTDEEVKKNLVANNKTINWIPDTIGSGRFGSWLENVQDWGISRNRYWGTPLNIWVCDDCGEMMSIGSIEELKANSDNCPDDIELHRPYIDDVLCNCPKCKGKMKRVPEVIDCWFDSGSMPFAQHHYPFENKELFEQQFPAKFISEAVDQTRGWFYSLLAISTLLFNKAPYENVIVLGHVQDANGQKMSKSKGNAVDPFEALETHGADAIRWYFYENSAPWLPNRFHDKAVTEGQRKFMGTIWNTYAFFVLYANIDEFDATKYTLEYDKLTVMDKWILSKLNTVVKTVDENLENYKITETARILENFVDELSNWYVRCSRERFWAKGMEQDKINAYMTLYTTLVTLSKVAAPMIPFMTETIYRNLVCSIDKNAPISVHLCDYPQVKEEWIDTQITFNSLYGIGEFTPGNEQQIMQLETIFRALKNTKIYPVWVHTFHPVTMDGIKCLMTLCERYPDIPVIFGHLGGSNWMDVIKFAQGHDNVYLDLSAAFASIATKMALAELPERCLYSSDAPYGEPYLYRQLIEFVSPDKRTAEMALGENISRLLELN